MQTLHASCVLIGAAGVLIRGPSGSGKSGLALAVIGCARREGLFARLVADDRVALHAVGGRLVAAAPQAIAGLCEQRGRGIIAVPFEPRALVRLLLDLVDPSDLPRMPEEMQLSVEIAGVRLPRRPLAIGDTSHQVGAALAAVREVAT